MNKRICIVLLAVGLGWGCNQNETPKKEKEVAVIPETTEYKFTFDKASLPKGFSMDNMTVEDTIKRVKVNIQYVTETESADDYKYTEVLMSTLLALANKEFTYYDIPKEKFHESTITYGVVDFSVGEEFISVRLVDDSYGYGGAHHNYSWLSLNYNRFEKRMYWVKDIFYMANRNDSLRFIQMVGRNLDDHTVELGVPFDSVDVFIRNDTEFLLGPELSWADGLRTAKLPMDSLERFFHHRWK